MLSNEIGLQFEILEKEFFLCCFFDQLLVFFCCRLFVFQVVVFCVEYLSYYMVSFVSGFDEVNFVF